MPSARAHDAVTFLLAAPAAGAAYSVTGKLLPAVVVGSSFLFGGLMFGPDLDTASRQYSRWGVFRFLWLPYRSFFKHRSVFTHGLLLGALLRVFYFAGVLTLATFLAAYGAAYYFDGRLPGMSDIASVWAPIDHFVHAWLGGQSFYAWCLAGVWLGAASHTLTDLAATYVKSGRVAKFY